ncbi:hypothetical protein HYALB_00006141 [Hymenoscyphus albidus]|uniref:Uncharacterized protein n=1 Tax=Hymenoscyphus albidus TaxID=595503 RepID=A0A9N9LME5_9HELO|nr:hypothetical protein HYALB_00006141 [Hymenoscyphus albidus]
MEAPIDYQPPVPAGEDIQDEEGVEEQVQSKVNLTAAIPSTVNKSIQKILIPAGVKTAQNSQSET